MYSTCSISPEENECQVHWALETFSCLSLAVSVSLFSSEMHSIAQTYIFLSYDVINCMICSA